MRIPSKVNKSQNKKFKKYETKKYSFETMNQLKSLGKIVIKRVNFFS